MVTTYQQTSMNDGKNLHAIDNSAECKSSLEKFELASAAEDAAEEAADDSGFVALFGNFLGAVLDSLWGAAAAAA